MFRICLSSGIPSRVGWRLRLDLILCVLNVVLCVIVIQLWNWIRPSAMGESLTREIYSSASMENRPHRHPHSGDEGHSEDHTISDEGLK